MKIVKRKETFKKTITWEEKSGLLNFLSELPQEVDIFNETFEFNIQHIVNPPAAIDGIPDRALQIGFVLIRVNPLLPEVTYCLYSVLKEKMLHGHIGIYKGNDITTLRQLTPVTDFSKGKTVLYDWLRQLVRASCEKRML